MILLAIVRKNFIWTCVDIWKVSAINLQTSLRFFLWCWMKSDVHKRSLDTRDELFARNLVTAVGIKKGEDKIRRRARDLRLQFSKCNEVYGDILEHLFWVVTNVPLLTYLLTPWSRVLLQKLTGSAASQEIPSIFGTQMFITVLTSARHLSISWANFIQSPKPPPNSWSFVWKGACNGQLCCKEIFGW